MHQSALYYAKRFFETYCADMTIQNCTLIEIGSQDVNGSLREVCPPHINYIGLDFVEGKGVDVLITDPYKLPMPDQSADVVVSSSCFEHSEFFWLVFLEAMRVLKPNGLFYLNAPSNGYFHQYPVDCWRFYPDSGHALVNWANRNGYDGALLESFIGERSAELVHEGGIWNDFVGIFLKDKSHLDRFPNRIISTLSHFSNGYTHESGNIINQSQNGPDIDIIRLLLSDIAKHTVQIANSEERIAILNQTVADREWRIAILNQTVADSEERIAILNQTVADSEERVANLREEAANSLVEKNLQIYAVQQHLNQLLQSNSWRLTYPLRKAATAIRLVTQFSGTSFLRKIAERSRIKPDLIFKSSINQIRASSLFDADYYLATYPDVRNASIDPAMHYFLDGWREHRNPSRVFNTARYLLDNPDVARAGINPLLHYLEHGQLEGRLPASVEALDAEGSEPIASVGENITNALIDAEIEAIRKSGLFDEAFYLSTYTDLQLPPHDLIKHYCEHGWREGRNPSDAFDTRFYLSTYGDIRNAGINPFWHYVVAGASELRHPVPNSLTSHDNNIPHEVIDAEVEAIRESGLFDESYYLSMYRNLQPTPRDAIRHYCEHGWREGRNPSDDFDTRSYLSTYSDIRNAGINPFWHYVVAGASELRHAVPDSAICYEDDIRFGVMDSDIKLLAFYSSPDWSNLRNERRASQGNSQPFLPHEELGFYDPLDEKILEKQARMAKRHGVHGFCFDLRVVEDGTITSQPIERFLEHDEIDIRFCAQVEISPQDPIEPLLKALGRVVSDRRQIRIENRPIILIAVLTDIQHAATSLVLLRRLLAEQGLGNPYLIARCGSAIDDSLGASLADLCDAVLDLPSTPVPVETGSFVPLNKNGVDVVPYCIVASQGVDRAQNAQRMSFPTYHAITLGRDNIAKKPSRPLVYTRFHTRDYRRWLDAAISSARIVHSEDRRFVFVNAWNDWNEGLFLEPDRQGGFGRMNETTRALLNIDFATSMPKVSVIVPNYNHEHFLHRRLVSIYGQTYKNIEVILLDDCSSDQSRSLLSQYAEAYPEITRTLYNDKNSGSAFRQWSKGIKAATGDLVWIAESDDYCDEHFLEGLVRCFDDEAVMLAYSKCLFINKDETLMQYGFNSYVSDLECVGKWNNSYVETAHNEVRSALCIKNTIPNASGVLFKRPINMPLLDDESWLSMVVAGDWVFYLHIIRGGKIAYNTEATNFFRRYEGSAAETTYKKEVFYRELGMASQTVQALYDVPFSVLDQCQRACKATYDYQLGRSDDEFLLWYDRDSIIQARASRLPNVMVSTMGFYPGGAEILPIRMANEFKRQGLSVLLMSAGLNPREDGVRRMLRNDVPLVETSDVETMKAIIHDFGIEALNTHQWHIQKYPLQVSDVFDELKAHVASLHGMIEHGEAFEATEEQLRKADQSVTTWVYTAEKNLAPFSKFGLYDKSSPRFVKLPNGMEPPNVVPIPREHMNIPDDAFVLCCVSRAIPDKGWQEMILAVERARVVSGRDIRLILVGNGPVYDDYCKVGLPDFVYLAGFSENSVGHYAAADMGIMLTKFKSESFPLTIVDCLFAGKPYIASDVGDIKNMLTTADAIAGEVIALENWEIPIEGAAQTIAAFATDKKKYSKALSLVQDVVNRYRIDVVASQYVRLFNSELAHESRVPA